VPAAPVGIAVSENDVRTSVPAADTPARYDPALLPAAGRASSATPGVTDCRGAPATTVQSPPTSAVPRPPVTVRLKASLASTCGSAGGGTAEAATVTERSAVEVAPSSSVTVSTTR
jgi:hypothetical protein